MKFHSYSDFEKLYEGMYDKLTGDIADEVWKIIHLTRKIYELDNESKAFEKEYDDYTSEKAKLVFDLKITIVRDSEDPSVRVDGFSDTTTGLPSEIQLFVTINPDLEPKIYSHLNASIQDTIRHEIEHLTQDGENKKPFRPRPVSPEKREKIQKIPREEWKYFILRDEIPAMVHGLYRQAKILKEPLDVSMRRYLSYFKTVDVSKNKKTVMYMLDDQKINDIMQKWLEFAKKNLPQAIYSE